MEGRQPPPASAATASQPSRRAQLWTQIRELGEAIVADVWTFLLAALGGD